MADQAERLRQLSQESADKDDGSYISLVESCRVVSVSSGKGGVGKTNLVVNLAIALAQEKNRVIILDADLGLANVDILVNVYPKYTLENVLQGEKDIKEIMLQGPYSIKIIPGGSGQFSLANLDQEKRRQLLDRFKSLEREADYLLIDTAAGLSRNVLNFVGASDESILVTTPEPTALTDAYGMIKVINEKQLKQEVHLVVNFVDNMAEGEEIFHRLQKVAQKHLPRLQLHYLGAIFRDPHVSKAVQNCAPVLLSYPQSQAANAIHRIGKRFIYRGEPEPEPDLEEKVAAGKAKTSSGGEIKKKGKEAKVPSFFKKLQDFFK